MIAVWYLSSQGLLFWDDFTYLNFADQINQGEFEVTTNHFTSRVGLLYPVAWTIKFFGIGIHSMVIFPLICALILLNLFFWLGYRTSQWVGLIGAALILSDYHLIYFSNHLFPELPLALCVFVFLLSYYLLLRNDIVPRYAGFLGALALFGAFLIKTTIILLLPLIIYLFVIDRRQKRHGSFWLVFIFLGVFFLVLNGLWYEEVKGNFFYRLQNIANNHVATPKTFFDKGGVEILKRLTYLPVLGFLKGGFFIPLLAALPAMFKLRKSDFSLQKAENIWPIASLFLLGAFWFMSTSWRFYSPMPTENRHIVYFIPVFIMTAALYWPKHGWFEWMRKNYLIFAILIGLLVIPLYAISKSGRTNFKELSSVIQTQLVENENAQLVITDGLTSYGYKYFYGMAEAEDIYLWFSEQETLDYLKVFKNPGYLLINRAHFNEDYNDTENYNHLIEQLQEYGINIGLLKQEGAVEFYLLTK